MNKQEKGITMPGINDVLLMWREQEKSLADLGMDHVDRGRMEQTFIRSRQIVKELDADLAKIRERPFARPEDNKVAIEAEQEKARGKLEPLTNIRDALQRDAAASAELPASASKGVDPEDVKVIRTRLNALDPVEILGEYSAAAASGDTATLIAVNDAHPSAYPSIARALASNPAIRHEAATQVRQRVNPDAERWAENKRTLASSLGAVIADVERLVGSRDSVARQARGE
jgi:hypothetical protein